MSVQYGSTNGLTYQKPEFTGPNPKACGGNKWLIVRSQNYRFSGAENGTIVYRNGVEYFNFNRNSFVIRALSAGDIISTNGKSLSFVGDGSGLTAISYAWAGYIFGHRFDRFSPLYYITATEKDGVVNICQDGVFQEQINVSKDAITSLAPPAGYGQQTFYSNVPIGILVGQLPSFDVMPLYPCEETKLYGCASSDGHMIPVFNNTSITEYATNGTTSARGTSNAGSFLSFTNVGSTQFTGPSVVVSSNYPLAAESQADGDGGEMTPFIGKEGFGNLFSVPEHQRDFVKFFSDVPAVISIYNSNGLINQRTLTGSTNGGGIYDIRLTGTEVYENIVYESSDPVTAIFESEDDDETVLMAFDTTPVSSQNVTISEFPYEINYNPRIATEGLSFYVDSFNAKSYPGTGSVWTDLINGHQMTLDGDYSFANGIMSFNNGGYAFIANNDDVYVDNESYSINVWFRSNGVHGGNFARIVAKDYYSFGNYCMALDNNNEYVRFGHNSSYTSNLQNEVSNQSIFDGSNTTDWFNYCGTYNVETGLMRLYRNGELISQKVESENEKGVVTGTANSFSIAKSAWPDDNYSNNWFNGSIPTVMLYKKELSEREVKQNYDALKNRFQS